MARPPAVVAVRRGGRRRLRRVGGGAGCGSGAGGGTARMAQPVDWTGAGTPRFAKYAPRPAAIAAIVTTPAATPHIHGVFAALRSTADGSRAAAHGELCACERRRLPMPDGAPICVALARGITTVAASSAIRLHARRAAYSLARPRIASQPLQIGAEVRRGLIAHARSFSSDFETMRSSSRRQHRVDRARRHRIAVEDAVEHDRGGVARKTLAARRHLVQHDAEREQIGRGSTSSPRACSGDM